MNLKSICPVCNSIEALEINAYNVVGMSQNTGLRNKISQHLEQKNKFGLKMKKEALQDDNSFLGRERSLSNGSDLGFDNEEFPLHPPSIAYPMRKISGCQFQMGSPDNEEGRDSDEQQHLVTLRNSFYIGLTEIPQDLWIEVFLHNPSLFRGIRRPVDSVTWFECIQFCNIYSKKMNLEPVYSYRGTDIIWNTMANGFRLPTEAEWELASRISRSEHLRKPIGSNKSNGLGEIQTPRG